MSNKVALVTGSSRGIGAAIAIRLAMDGYDVAVNYNNNEERAREVLSKIQLEGQKGIIVKADVSDAFQVEDMFSTVRESLGEVDLLVTNAGISGTGQIQDITQDKWRKIFAVNVDGTFNAVKCAIPYMLSEHSGCIVMISSMWGVRGASCESAYSASKAAIVGFSRSLASELAPSGIRVNCVAPGVIDTEMLDELSSDSLESLAEETPLRRLGKPEDIAELVSFLSSDNASFITGQVISDDGGFTV